MLSKKEEKKRICYTHNNMKNEYVKNIKKDLLHIYVIG